MRRSLLGRFRPAVRAVRATPAGHDRLTPVTRADMRRTAGHALPTIAATQADARQHVTRLVADLAERGALDAGTPYVLDHWVDSLLDGWLTHVRQQAEERLAEASRQHAVLTQHLTEEACELVRLRRERDEAAGTYRRRHADLDPPVPSDPSEPARVTEMPQVIVPPRPALAAVLERTGRDIGRDTGIDLRAPAPRERA